MALRASRSLTFDAYPDTALRPTSILVGSYSARQVALSDYAHYSLIIIIIIIIIIIVIIIIVIIIIVIIIIVIIIIVIIIIIISIIIISIIIIII